MDRVGTRRTRRTRGTRVAALLAGIVATAAIGCTSDDPEPEDEPMRIDGPAQVDESLLDGPGADLEPGG